MNNILLGRLDGFKLNEVCASFHFIGITGTYSKGGIGICYYSVNGKRGYILHKTHKRSNISDKLLGYYLN